MKAHHAFFRWLCLAASLAACAPSFKIERVRVGVAKADPPGAPRVLILKSDQNPLFDEVLKVFEEQTDYELVYYLLPQGVQGSDIQTLTHEERAALVITMGTRAAKVVADAIGDVPMLFAMVPNAARLPELRKANVAGISLETPAASDFAQFKLIAPSLKRVLTFYSEESQAVVLQAKVDLVPWGIEVVPVFVKNLAEIRDAYQKLHGECNGVWLESDTVVMNPQAFMFLRNATRQNKIAFFASLSSDFAKAGALAAVSIDFSALGSQAANIASRLLDDHVPPSDVGIEPPIGGRIAINLITANLIGAQISQRALLAAQDVIGSRDDVP
jgi:ABC-type uncharacterized transport system substrate-binding protein